MQTIFDWGAPRPADWPGPKERIVARVPVYLANDLRRRADEEGISLTTLINRLLAGAVDVEEGAVLSAASWPNAVDHLIGS